MGKKVAVLGAAMLAVLGASAHCGGPAKEGAAGADCFRAEECAAGLVCIEKKCTSDQSSVSIVPDAGVVLPEASVVAPD